MLANFKLMGLAVFSAGLLTVGANAQTSLATQFNSNNGLSAQGSGNMFDVNVKRAGGITITSFDVNCDLTTGKLTIDVYICPDSYDNAINKIDLPENKPLEWVKVASGTTSSPAGKNKATKIDTTDFYLAPGKYGVYIIYTSDQTRVGLDYTGTGSTGSKITYKNADLEIVTGIAKSGASGKGWNASSRFFPRHWNGTVYYSKDDKANSHVYGRGCVGTNNKVPTISLSGPAKLGSTISLTISGMNTKNPTKGLLFLSLRRTTIDLKNLGMPDCSLRLVTDFGPAGVVGINGTGTVKGIKIPNLAILQNLIVYAQAASEDSKANGLQVVASDTLSVRIGK